MTLPKPAKRPQQSCTKRTPKRKLPIENRHNCWSPSPDALPSSSRFFLRFLTKQITRTMLSISRLVPTTETVMMIMRGISPLVARASSTTFSDSPRGASPVRNKEKYVAVSNIINGDGGFYASYLSIYGEREIQLWLPKYLRYVDIVCWNFVFPY